MGKETSSSEHKQQHVKINKLPNHVSESLSQKLSRQLQMPRQLVAHAAQLKFSTRRKRDYRITFIRSSAAAAAAAAGLR